MALALVAPALLPIPEGAAPDSKNKSWEIRADYQVQFSFGCEIGKIVVDLAPSQLSAEDAT